MTELRGVLFDLDGTLLDHEGAVTKALDVWLPQLTQQYGVAGPPGAVAYALWNQATERHLLDWRARRISFIEQRRRRLRDFLPAIGIAPATTTGNAVTCNAVTCNAVTGHAETGRRSGRTTATGPAAIAAAAPPAPPMTRIVFADAELDAIFSGYLREYEAAWAVFDDVEVALAKVAGAGLQIAVLTNGTVEQQNKKITRVGLAGRVGPVFTPDGLGVAKPDPNAFRVACAQWGLAPATVLSVGDRHDLDVVPARQAGLRAVHLDRADTDPHRESHRITTLHDLLIANAAPA